MTIKYGIVSYHRPKCSTYKTLKSIGVPEDDIVISLNDTTEKDEYRAIYPTANIITRVGNNCASNRNNVLDHYGNGQHVILLDDDVYGFQRHEWNGAKFGHCKTIKDYITFNSIQEECFEYMERNDCVLGGCPATNNNMSVAPQLMKGRVHTFGTIMQGGWSWMITDRSVRYDSRFDMVEDYELCLRLIKLGYGIVRFNNLVPNKAYMHRLDGGMSERYENGEQERWLRAVAARYPRMVSVCGENLRMKKGIARNAK